MNGAVDLSYFSMIMGILLLLIPIGVVFFLKLGLMKNLLISSSRMIVQLVLIGFFLEYLFKLNSWFVNVLWFLVMILVAVFSVINNSNLRIKHFLLPVFFSLFLSSFTIVLYLNIFVAKLDNIFEAQYMIAIGGMILGNILRSNIVGLGEFYKGIRKEETLYFYKLSLGATRFEAIRPFLKYSFVLSLKPTLANMATVGIVSLPGMMTGQILGGSVPLVAIKYQIVIMVAMMASTVLGIGLSIFFSLKTSFNKSGTLKPTIFS